VTAPLARVDIMAREPIPVRVVRYGCPSCGRTASSRSRTREHMSRCWWDPANRGCKTCRHFDEGDSADWATGYQGSDEGCARGVDLSGRRGCARCGGDGLLLEMGGATECQTCAGDGAEVKPGPIVHCAEWEPRLEAAR
jgi:hypothetical protein